jgi:hypothetical protein
MLTVELVSLISFVWTVRVVVSIEPVKSVPAVPVISYTGFLIMMKEAGISKLSHLSRPSFCSMRFIYNKINF